MSLAEAQAIDDPGHAKNCALPGNCPLCGEPNRCRLETGEGYKGPCWCERPTVSAAALRRLLGELAAPRCLCAGCLESIAADPEITREALESRRRCNMPSPNSSPTPVEGDCYWEVANMVFTAQFHLRRGSCCGSGCRHCPYA